MIVGAAIVHPRFGGIGPAMHLTALALSIDLMILDHPDHWLKGPEYAPWREGFILIETSSNPIADFESESKKLCFPTDGHLMVSSSRGRSGPLKSQDSQR